MISVYVVKLIPFAHISGAIYARKTLLNLYNVIHSCVISFSASDLRDLSFVE